MGARSALASGTHAIDRMQEFRQVIRRKAIWQGLVALCLLPGVTRADVEVLIGPTPIPEGEAKANEDITLMNDRVAVTLAVRTAPPYGVPRGAIVDAAPRVGGRLGRDTIEYADFIPNSWSAWPNSFQKVDILERSPERAVVRAERDWGKVLITTYYTLERQSDYLSIRTIMRNSGDQDLTNLMSGLTLWPTLAYLFAVPGTVGTEDGKADNALADRVVAYDENFFVALHAGYFDHVENRSRDLFKKHSLAPGESREFEAWLQIGARGDLAPVIRAEIARRKLAFGTVRGIVKDLEGGRVTEPIVVVEKQGHTYGWTMGQDGAYELTLPPGDYSLYATARAHSQSKAMPLRIRPGDRLTRNFSGLLRPGRIRFSINDARSGEPLDARIAIVTGQKPAIGFLGRRVFFSELERKGYADLTIAPGVYEFKISYGGGFLAARELLRLNVLPGEQRNHAIKLVQQFTPRARGWYAADLHHHADQAEGSTPPPDLVRSQLAAGLDLLFVSDHDSTANFTALQTLATQRGVAFIPGIELSPSWGHFNAYPLQLDAKLSVDTGTATAAEIFADARRMGAIAIQANHPFIPYGYLTSAKANLVPGGFSANFDLLEINSGSPGDDRKVLERLWQHWNAAEPVYLSAGSDTHDVWNDESGHARVYAYIEGPVSSRAFAESLRRGRSYVSLGPLITPAIAFGERLTMRSQQPFSLDFELQSVAGLRRAELVSGGKIISTLNFAGASEQQARASFPLATHQSTWYSLIVRDAAGRKAYTNPIWVDVQDN